MDKDIRKDNIKMIAMILIGSAIMCAISFAFLVGCEAVIVDISRKILR